MAAFTYSELELSRVDAELASAGAVTVVLSARTGRVLVGLVEAARIETSQSGILRRAHRVLRGLWSVVVAVSFHGRLFGLSRAIVQCSANTTWRRRSDGQWEFLFSR